MVPLFDRWIAWAVLSLAGLLWAQPAKPLGLTLSQVSNRLITPNGDQRNDNVVFRLSNPRQSAVKGTIYDLKGKVVFQIDAVFEDPAELIWDGKAGGQAVASGVYVYVLEGEDTVFTGTVVVVR